MSSKAIDSFAKNDDAVLGVVIIVGIIVIYYVLKNAISGIGSGISSAADAVGAAVDSTTTSIANAYVGATSGPSITPSGAIVFPDGSTATVAAVSAANSGLSGSTFYWNGLQYTLTSNFDSSGNRIAQNGLDNPSGGWQ